MEHEGEVLGIELDLTPAGARSLIGMPARELSGMVVRLDALLRGCSDQLLEELTEARTWEDRFGVIDRSVCSSMDLLPTTRSEVANAWRLIVSGAHPRVAKVADAVGWSGRHLVESFAAEYGLTPKQRFRITRFHRSKQMLQRSGGHNLAAVAAACGYFGQSHLAGEWRRLAGRPPSQWLRTEELSFLQDAGHRRRSRLGRMTKTSERTATVWPTLRYADARAAIRFLVEAFCFEEVCSYAGAVE